MNQLSSDNEDEEEDLKAKVAALLLKKKITENRKFLKIRKFLWLHLRI